MARIEQRQLFAWEDVEGLGDLERLRLVLQYIPDEPLMRLLEDERAKGRDDYPVRAVWNSLLAGVVFQHASIESLRRELARNAQLRALCGFQVARGEEAIPPSWAYTRFLKRLMAHSDQVDGIFDDLVRQLTDLLEGFGHTLASDGKGIRSHARKRKEDEQAKERDGRRDMDADVGVKKYAGKRSDGSLWEKVISWFGYKLHLVVDATYELPIAYEVTRASANEVPVVKTMKQDLAESHPEIVERSELWLADKGQDDTAFIRELWDDHNIKPVIDIRNCWKDGEETRLVNGTRNVVYNYAGDVFCVCMATGEQRKMAFGGFEQDRETLKYRCPAQHYGFQCEGAHRCAVASAVRIPLSLDRRIFTPLARSSYAWKNAYKKRSAVERVNSRLDVSFGFEEHFIRGMAKMKLRCGLALVVMLAMALARAKEQQVELMRSLVKRA